MITVLALIERLARSPSAKPLRAPLPAASCF